jgi:hypothetical protein
MTTKFQQTKKLYMDILLPDKKREGGLLYSRTLLDQNMSEYSPVLLEMYYSPSTILANINRALVPAMKPLQEFTSLNVSN